MDCEVSERGVASLHREYNTLVNAGLGASHEWLDTEEEILKKVPLLPRESIKVRLLIRIENLCLSTHEDVC